MSPVLWWRNLCLWLVTWLQLKCYDDCRLVLLMVVVTAEVLQK